MTTDTTIVSPASLALTRPDSDTSRVSFELTAGDTADVTTACHTATLYVARGVSNGSESKVIHG
jgi:hypothetical protein